MKDDALDGDLGRIHNVSYFLSALAHGAERNLGKGSLSICSLAGKKFGMEAVSHAPQAGDPLEAVRILRDALDAQGIVWDFEPFAGDRPPVEEAGDLKRVRLVFRTCMVRNALFRYAHDQKQSLCYMAHGVFAGAMEAILPNTTVSLEIIHAGPNACLKEMILETKK